MITMNGAMTTMNEMDATATNSKLEEQNKKPGDWDPIFMTTISGSTTKGPN
jgi:hypothetical protein